VQLVEVDMVGAKPAQAVAIDVRTCSGRPLAPISVALPDASVVPESTRPTLVASTARSRRPPISARPTSSSLVKGPYTSAVSISVTPRSSAWWITAMEVASSRGAAMS
jgi:hypothetical protein